MKKSFVTKTASTRARFHAGALARTLAPQNLLVDQVLLTAVALALSALMFLPHPASAAQAKAASANLAALDMPQDRSKSMGGFEVAAPPTGPSSAFSFKPLSKGEKATYEPISVNLTPHFYSTEMLVTLNQHDVWPEQSWTLVNYMPWPPSLLTVMADKPLPVIRQHSETAAVAPAAPVVAPAPKPAASNGAPQGNDPTQHQQAAAPPAPPVPVSPVAAPPVAGSPVPAAVAAASPGPPKLMITPQPVN